MGVGPRSSTDRIAGPKNSDFSLVELEFKSVDYQYVRWIFVVLPTHVNTKRASWWAIFLVNGRLEGSPICDQHGSERVVPVLKRTSQINANEFGFSPALEAREKHFS